MKTQNFKGGKWWRYNLTVDEQGMRLERTPFWKNLRLNVISWLGGVDRRSVQTFARDFMEPNGAAIRTITEDGAKVQNETISAPNGEVGIAVAPWAQDVVITDCRFIGSPPPKTSLDSDTAGPQNPAR